MSREKMEDARRGEKVLRLEVYANRAEALEAVWLRE
jgi:hypothetical protein